MKADFSGYATKSGIKCSDGRTVTAEAFKHQNAMTVPLVWQHGHNKPDNVLGHGILQSRPDGMYVQGFFNDTPQGKTARELVQHKDINALSIYANGLVEKTKTVLHGTIREVSLVLAGANPGALIDFVRVAHADGTIEDTDDEAVIYMDQPLVHGDESPETHEDDELDEDEIDAEEALAHASQTVQDIVDGWSDEDKNVVAFLIGAALDQAKANVAAAHSDIDTEGDLEHQEGKNEMTRNVFEQKRDGEKELRHSVSGDDMYGIIQDAAKLGSLRDAVQGYAIKHGIDDIDVLFPDAQTLDQMPQFNKRRTEWVQGVLNGAHHSPFARVKTVWADLTQEEARAKGYIKGSYKIEEWFNVMKRVTTPTTIYKKQKLDRDDIVDITDFDVIAWIKQEMRMMLEEELARAILIGDGRSVSDPDKIKDPGAAPAGDGIRSIINDHELFVTTMNVNVSTATSYDVVVDEVMDAMEHYKGTGTPVLYTTIKQLNRFLKAKDGMGRRLWETKAQVASALGVRDIVTVDVMNDVPTLIGIIVNLDDYNVGADKGGEVSLFDDFDIDYNQQKYLIETRLSGALTKIKAAIVIKSTGATDQLLADPTVPTYDRATGVVTIPTTANVVYKNADTAATLTAGAQAALTAGQTLNVQAVPTTGHYFANDAGTLWPFFRRTAS